MSTDPTPESERRQIVKDDARKLQEPGDRGSTYMSQSIARIGEELGGRFRQGTDRYWFHPLRPCSRPARDLALG